MACRRRTSLIVTLIAGLAALFATGIVGIAGIGAAGAGDLTAPVRIEIEPRSRESAVGGSIDYAVTLRNAVGDPVAAPKQMTIDVETTLPSGRTETRQVVIGPGQTDAGGVVPVAEPGAIRIGVSNPELMGGGVVVFGKPGAPSRGLRLPSSIEAPAPVPAPAPTPTPATVPSRAPASVSTPAPTAAPSVGASAPAASASAAVSAPAQPAPGGGVPGSVDTDAATAPDVPETAAGPASAPIESSAAVVSLDPGRLPASAIGDRTLMLYVPEAEILADGSNGAEVTVYLDPCGTVPSDVVVRLAVTRGRLDPAIVRIPQGECSASTIWRSERMSLGEATLSVLVSTPNLRRGDTVVRRFVPPIHSLRLTPNPAEITLLTQGDVLAQLHDDVNDVPVPTDRPMKLTLALREGNGALRPLELVFDAGDSTARAAFRPTYWGKVVVAGQIPFRLEEHAVFEVKSGARVFILSAVGGLIGGLLAYRAKKEKPLRILIGLVTGFALFAFFLFFGAENILEVTGGLNVLNPVSVFLLSLAGGWAGTAVLAWALKRIGIEA